MLTTGVNGKFLDLFHHLIDDYELDDTNKLNVFTLKIKNNRFAYNDLVDLLGNNLHHFALSRAETKELIDRGEYYSLVKKAKKKFRTYTSNEGEIGEVLLYCLLESHLQAPKILTKLELKTASNDYVKGADGVHLLKLDEENYQLILGESKLNAKLKDGIKEAFKSIKKLVNDEQDKIEIEYDLINSQLVKEAYDESLYKKIKTILLPTSCKEELYLDNAFGIFLGYNISISTEDQRKKNKEFRQLLNKRIEKEILDNVEKIKTQLSKDDFIGYNFYIYVIPFSDLAENRKKLIKELTE